MTPDDTRFAVSAIIALAFVLFTLLWPVIAQSKDSCSAAVRNVARQQPPFATLSPAHGGAGNLLHCNSPAGKR